VAYTHGQPAQPTTFGHYLGAIIEVLLRDIERLEAGARDRRSEPDGSGRDHHLRLPDRPRIAWRICSASPRRCRTPIRLHRRDRLPHLDLFSAIELLFLHLGRLIQDLQFWTSFEVGQLYVPNAFVQISSIMPQKRNPVPIEHLRHLASRPGPRAAGRRRRAQHALHRHERQRGRDPRDGLSGFDAGLRVLDLLPRRSARAHRWSTASPSTSAAPASRSPSSPTRWCAAKGCPSGSRHEIAADVARAVVAMAGDLPRTATPPSRGLRAHVGRSPPPTRRNSPRWSRPSTSSPCATVSAARLPQALGQALAGYRGLGSVSSKSAGRSPRARRKPRGSRPPHPRALMEVLMARIELEQLVKRYGKRITTSTAST
jgi:argininosuccinate lyase